MFEAGRFYQHIEGNNLHFTILATGPNSGKIISSNYPQTSYMARRVGYTCDDWFPASFTEIPDPKIPEHLIEEDPPRWIEGTLISSKEDPFMRIWMVLGYQNRGVGDMQTYQVVSVIDKTGKLPIGTQSSVYRANYFVIDDLELTTKIK